jgi:hypothetical protein
MNTSTISVNKEVLEQLIMNLNAASKALQQLLPAPVPSVQNLELNTTRATETPEELLEKASKYLNATESLPFAALETLCISLQAYEGVDTVPVEFQQKWTLLYTTAINECLKDKNSKSAQIFDVFTCLEKQAAKLKDNQWVLALLVSQKECFCWRSHLIHIAQSGLKREVAEMMNRMIVEQGGKSCTCVNCVRLFSLSLTPTIIVKAPEDFLEKAKQHQAASNYFAGIEQLTLAIQTHETTVKIGHQFKKAWKDLFAAILSQCFDLVKSNFRSIVQEQKSSDFSEYATKYKPVFDGLLQQAVKLKDNHWLLTCLSAENRVAYFFFEPYLITLAQASISRDNLVLLKFLIRDQDAYLMRLYAQFIKAIFERDEYDVNFTENNHIQVGDEEWNVVRQLKNNFSISFMCKHNGQTYAFTYDTSKYISPKQMFEGFFSLYLQVVNKFFPTAAAKEQEYKDLYQLFEQYFGVALQHYSGIKSTAEFCQSLVSVFSQVVIKRVVVV